MFPSRFPLRRLVATLLVVLLPATIATMPLAGATGQAAYTSNAHAGHHHGAPAHHPAGHQQCCDLCGVTCGGCAGLDAPGAPAPATVRRAAARPPLVRPSTRTARVPHLLPPPVGPPALLA